MSNERLDKICEYADFFDELAKRYRRLRSLATKDGASKPFIRVTEAAGILAYESVKHTAELLDIVIRAGIAEDESGREGIV